MYTASWVGKTVFTRRMIAHFIGAVPDFCAKLNR